MIKGRPPRRVNLPLNHQYLLKHPELFQYVIGISFNQFLDILPKFSRALRNTELRRAYSKVRIRGIGGGRKATLVDEYHQLFFILLYYKVYPTFRFAQVLYSLDKRNIQLWVKRLSPVLFEALGYELSLKRRLYRINSYEAWIEEYPQLKEFLVDCTERPIQRPKDNTLQEEYYSGKKKHHSVKNQIIVSPKSQRILTVSDTTSGRVHDKKVFDTDPTILRAPPGSIALGDSAYLGVDINPHIRMITPQKKPPGGELTLWEKANNTAISRVRVGVEHPLSYLKHFGILAQRFRGRVTNKQNLIYPSKLLPVYITLPGLQDR